MSQNDLISDALTRIRNAVHAGSERVTLPSSRVLSDILRVLKEEGYIANFRTAGESAALNRIRVQLKPVNRRRPVIRNLTRISRSSHRIYTGYRKMPRVLRGMGIAILSTPKGIMTDSKARQLKVGGEVLCKVY